MSDALNIKVEKVFTEFLRESGISGLNVYEGHDDSEVVELPSLVCFAGTETVDDEMPGSTGIKSVTLSLELRVESEDNYSKIIFDQYLDELETALDTGEPVIEFANAPASLPDLRQTKDLHIYDLIDAGKSTDFDGTQWVRNTNITVLCQSYDRLTV